jgi:23S rRNA (guanosine2251-2'-O)-methyltransferase
MAGNSARRGAKRNPGSKKGATVGSGGQARRGLRGKGPTPRAEERTGHPASRRAASASRRSDKGADAPRSGGGGPRSRARSGGGRDSAETVAGRNPVVEALRADVPATALYVAHRVEADDRVREALRLATSAGVPLLEVPRGELDRLTAGRCTRGWRCRCRRTPTRTPRTS